MNISDRIKVLVPAVALALAVSACSIFDDDKPAYVEKPVDELYNRGVDQMGSRKFADAALTFEEVERQHPY